MKNKKIIILHGWESAPEQHWFLRAKDKFEKDGYEVFVPQMPGGYFPKLDVWLKIIDNHHPDENWILIGHSLGGVAILRYLETAQKKIGQAILVATPVDPMRFDPISNFFAGGLDFKKIKENTGQIDLIFEDNDPMVPLSHGQKLAQQLGCKLIVQPGFNHFDTIDLDLLLKLFTVIPDRPVAGSGI